MADNTPVTGSYISNQEFQARVAIGKHVLYFSLIIICLLGCISLIVVLSGSDTGQNKFGYVKDILTIILPLIGTWVGTVLAFYFSRENYAMAAQQAASLVSQLTPEQRLQSIPVFDVMIDMFSSTTLKLALPPGNNLSLINLKTNVIDLMEQGNRNRLPIIDASGKVLYIIHQSYIDKFLVKQPVGTQAINLTLNDLLNDKALSKIFQTFAIVGKNARLIVVKNLLDGNPDCSDAFVTEDGTSGSKAVGWITNVIVQEKSTA
ncbi:hypothetical protein B9037_003015 [Klebsiella aerogenes]|uniref:hypothetical protein n=1 Tax=Klebsiella aerogenes TaxID=548 RepID=UPI000B416DD9|nr:hypothetical protein [Klebsiella aerogenes]ELA2275155.1 hypothetical protein [Klebsiella aerogenes]ELT7618384.1 hypothetical protein [Klebsiella aerogenes]ELY3083638.1 hypothetical protein [Klebsiella aerogenes]MEB7636427.1 hypothetical protein [Klebsiella aerogenes]RNT35756.1 hypothetical protein B9037_003015 [Klebsiella aerogenes]